MLLQNRIDITLHTGESVCAISRLAPNLQPRRRSSPILCDSQEPLLHHAGTMQSKLELVTDKDSSRTSPEVKPAPPKMESMGTPWRNPPNPGQARKPEPPIKCPMCVRNLVSSNLLRLQPSGTSSSEDSYTTVEITVIKDSAMACRVLALRPGHDPRHSVFPMPKLRWLP